MRASMSIVVGICSTVAVAGTWTSTRATPAVLAPGSPDISTTHLRNASGSFRYLSRMPTGDTTEREIGAGRSEQVLTRQDGKPALLLVSTSARNGQTYLDSAVVMQSGLAPVWETARRGGGVTRWDYSGKTVRLTLTSPDSGTRTREHTYDVPVFNFQELDVLIRSLPMREGYEAILPLYSEGSEQLEMDSVRVLTRGGDGVWSVRFADPAIVATYGIDGTTREIVRHEVLMRKSGAHMRKVIAK
jgi:hypothetical protein